MWPWEPMRQLLIRSATLWASFLDQLEGYEAHHAQGALASDVVSGSRSEHIIPLDRLSQGPVVTN